MLTRNKTGRFVKTYSPGIDKLRGLAIVLMVLDHIILVSHGPFIIRETITRAAMPIFFVLSGHLIKKVTWRLFIIGYIGLTLPTFVTFLDDPNVLFWYAAFAPIIVLLRRNPNMLPLVLVVIMGLVANNHLLTVPNSYPPLMLLALMIIGAMIPRKSFTFSNSLPSILIHVGRFPLTLYVATSGILQVLS